MKKRKRIGWMENKNRFYFFLYLKKTTLQQTIIFAI